MNKQSITFSASEQTLEKLTGSEQFAGNTVSYVEATFTLGTNWAGFDSVSAVWKSQYYEIATVLDAYGKCDVPAEVMYYKSKVFVNLVGVTVSGDEITDRLTTYPILAFTIDSEAIIEGTETTDITPSQFDQFVSQVSDDASAAAASAAAAAASAASLTVDSALSNSSTNPVQNKVINGAITDLKEELTYIENGVSGGVNLFNSSTADIGYALTRTGAITANSNRFTSDYISVLGNYTYIYIDGGTDNPWIASYDNSHNFISGSFTTNSRTYKTPHGTAYIKICNYNTFIPTAMIYAQPTIGIDDIYNYMDMEYIKTGAAKASLAEYNATISASTAYISPTENTLFVVRKYPVTKGHHYIIYGTDVDVHYDAYAIAAYSKTEYTGSTITSDILVAGSGATPTNYYERFFARDDGYVYLQSYGDRPVASLYEAELVSDILYKLTNSNKDIIKIQAFGDSITDDSWRADETTWLTLLPDYLTQRTLQIKNEAVGGSHIGHGKVNNPGGKYDDLTYNYVYDLMTNTDIFDPDSDIITMLIGTNDFNSGELGEWGDNTVDTFYGAARLICEYISNNTDALFVVITPIARPSNADSSKPVNAWGEHINSYGATLRDYADALIKTCEFYQFPVIDLFHNIGWNQYNVRPYLDTSGIHPSIRGSNVICANISSGLKNHLGA